MNLREIFTKLMPHRHCFAPKEDWIPVYITSNVTIFICYLAIVLFLLYVAFSPNFKRYRIILFSYAFFMVSCSVGHLLMVVNMYSGFYIAESIWHLFSAILLFSATIITYVNFNKIKIISNERPVDNLKKHVAKLNEFIERYDHYKQ